MSKQNTSKLLINHKPGAKFPQSHISIESQTENKINCRDENKIETTGIAQQTTTAKQKPPTTTT